MKILAPLLSAVLAFFPVPLHAAELPPEILSPSPDGKYIASVTGSEAIDEFVYFNLDIRSAATGETISHIPATTEEHDPAQFYPQHILWSPDSRVLAIGFNDSGHSLPRLFAQSGKSFTEVPCPDLDGDYNGPEISPSRWHRGHRLTLSVRGPQKGHGTPFEGKLEIKVDPKTATAKFLSQSVKYIEYERTEEDGPAPAPSPPPLLEISEIQTAPTPGSSRTSDSGLLIKACRFPRDPMPTASIVLPGDSLGRLGPENASRLYLASSDSRVLCYRSQWPVQAIAMTRAGGLLVYPDLCGSAIGSIVRTKLGREIFPGGGLRFIAPAVDSLTSTTITLSSPVTPATLGGATKTLTCTLKLQPDSTVKLLDWHLSGK